RYASSTPPPRPATLLPYTTLFRSYRGSARDVTAEELAREALIETNRELTLAKQRADAALAELRRLNATLEERNAEMAKAESRIRSEEHTSELQSRFDLVCRLLLEK